MKNLFCFFISFASLNCAAMEMNSEEHIAFVSCKGARILKDKIFMLAQAITMQKRGTGNNFRRLRYFAAGK